MARFQTDRLLTSGEVATLFRVHTKTVVNWANAGKLPYVLTPSGRRRYPESEVLKLMHVESETRGGSE